MMKINGVARFRAGAHAMFARGALRRVARDGGSDPRLDAVLLSGCVGGYAVPVAWVQLAVVVERVLTMGSARALRALVRQSAM